MGRSGEAITFVTPDEEKKWREIERGVDTRFAIRRWGQKGPEASREPAEGLTPTTQRESPSPDRAPPPAPAPAASPAQRRRPWRGLRRTG